MAQQDRINLTNVVAQSEDGGNLKIVLTDLVQQINAAKIPIIVGPNDKFPEGMLVGQPVIDWSSGTSVMKIFNGKNLI